VVVYQVCSYEHEAFIMASKNASSQLIVDLFEQPSFPLDGNFVASVCGAFGVFYFFVAAASVYIMHRTAFTL
jgi:hypothetical protein